jgi:trans-2,3-dihydro-3-hydroxyanthranilate isomerase
MAELRYVLLDVFTDTPLRGNQLAVFETGQPVQSSELMQAIARELNLSETVFISAASSDGADLRARIFTPRVELPFAGHPTLGSAIVQARATRSTRVVVETGVGLVPVSIDWSGDAPLGWMTQPPPETRDCPFAGEALAALGITSPLAGPEIVRQGPEFVVVVLGERAELAALAPNHGALAALGDYGFYCAARTPDAWEARMFAPALGVGEDPATGSGAGAFASFLVAHGLARPGDETVIHQGLRIGRDSLLRTRVRAPAGRIEQVEVGGNAVVIGAGALSSII